ncbi:multidrug resistance protein Fnx1 [Apiospora saccharicola]
MVWDLLGIEGQRWAWFTAVIAAIQADLTGEEAAPTTTALYTFLRNFGSIWDITIPSAVFNGHIKRFSRRIKQQEDAKRVAREEQGLYLVNPKPLRQD